VFCVIPAWTGQFRAIAALNISESPAPSSGYDFNQNAAGVLRLMLQDIVSMLEESGIPPKILGTIVTYDETDRVETLNLKEAVAYYSDLNPLGDKEKKTQALKFIGLLVVHIEKQVKFSIDLIKKEFDYIYKECIESEESCKTVLKLVKGHISDYCDPNKISQYDSIIAQIADKAPNNSADWSPYFFSNSEWNGNGLKSAIATREIGGFEVNKINGDIIIESGSTYKLAKVKKELVGGFGFSKYQCNEYLKSQDPAAAEQNKLVFDLFEFNFKSIEEGRSRIDGTKNPCEVDGYSVDYVGPNKSSIISIYDESRGCKFARLKIACKMKSSTNVFPPNFNYKLEILGVRPAGRTPRE
jgi:hypothetical protein